jgi:hypothetical protein
LGIQIFDFNKEHLLSFAGDLTVGNLIKVMHLAITDEANLCGVHEDQNNDPAFSSVPVTSKFILVDDKRFQVSIIMYSRQSIFNYRYLKQKNTTYGPAVIFVMSCSHFCDEFLLQNSSRTKIHSSRQLSKTRFGKN